MAPSLAWILSPRLDSMMVFQAKRLKKTWVLDRSMEIPVLLSNLVSGQGSGLDDLAVLGKSRPAAAEILLLWPAELSSAGSFRFPGLPESDLKNVVTGELEAIIPWDVDECQIAFTAEKRQSGWEAYGWATPRSLLDNAVKMLSVANLEPKRIVPESFSLFPGLGTPTRGATDTEAVAAPMPGRLLTLFSTGGFPHRESVLSCPPGADRDDLIDQILAAHFLLDLPEKCEFSWVGTKSPDAPPGPDSEIEWRRADEERIRLFAQGTWTGWSVRRFLPDFRNGPMAFRKDQEHLVRRFRSVAAMGLILVLLAGVDAWIHVHGLRTRVERTKSFLDSIARQSLAPAPVIEPISQLRQKRNTLLEQKHFLSRGTNVIALLRDIATAPPASVPFEMVSVSVGNRRLSLSGKTDSFQHVETVRQALLKSPHIRSLSVQSARLDIDRKTVAFRLGGIHD
jgi:hypothetical protein